MQTLAVRYTVPIEVIAVVCYKESTFRQYDAVEGAQGFLIHNVPECTTAYSNSSAPVPPGLGLMMLTGSTATSVQNGDIVRQITDWRYNLEAGVQVLVQKYRAAISGDQSCLVDLRSQTESQKVLENWFYAIQMYNGSNSVAVTYRNDAYSLIADQNQKSQYKGLFPPVTITRPEQIIPNFTSGTQGFCALADGRWKDYHCNVYQAGTGSVHVSSSFSTYNPGNSIVITGITPASIRLNIGETFPVTATITASAPRTLLLGTSLLPAGQTSGAIDDPSHDVTVSLASGQSSQQRSFTVPTSTAAGVYDLVVALWQDTNNNGLIDGADQQITLYKASNAVTVQAAGGGCAYSVYPSGLNLTTPGGAASTFDVTAGPSCSWSAVSNNPDWITVTSNASGTGSKTVFFSVAGNTTSTQRVGSITVQTQSFMITQVANSAPSNQIVSFPSNFLVAPPSYLPGYTITIYSDIRSSINQSVLLGASITPHGTTTIYTDSAHDIIKTLSTGTYQYWRDFTIPLNVAAGTYDVTLSAWADTNSNGVIDAATDTLLGSYTDYGSLTIRPPVGSIQTTLTPTDVVNAGAAWNIDGGNWFSSGYTAIAIATGNHTIGFRPVNGWSTPSDQIATVNTNQTTQIASSYSLNATLDVVASPSNAGTVAGGGAFPVGSAQQISAAANAGWIFVRWNDGSTQNPRLVTVPSGGITYVASFTALPAIPQITSTSTAGAQVNVPFGYQITASNSPTSFGASGLPIGLSVNATGLISGTPTQSGTFSVSLSATNAGGTGTAALTVVVAAAPPSAPGITSPLSASTQVGQSFAYQITATNAPAGFNASGLPSGLDVNGTSGLISGTPTASGTYQVALSATNAGGTGTANLTLTVAAAPVQPPAITSAAGASTQVGTSFTYQITATNAPTSFGASGLPANLSVNGASGIISGATTQTGTFSVGLTAMNAGGTGSASLTLIVSATPVVAPVITSAASASAQVNVPFMYQIVATNNPTSFGASGLPSGLSLNPAGLISGAATQTGSFPVSLTATNAGGAGTATLTLTVTATPVLPPAITSAASAAAQTGSPFSYQITASNSPTSFTASGLPGGLSINGGTGVISGTPSTAGTYTVALGATNAGGTGTASLTLIISAAPVTIPVITSAASAAAQITAPFTYQITASNSPVSFGVSGLPTGLSATSAGLISGVPAQSGIFPISLYATNANGTGTATLTLTVLPAPLATPVIGSPTAANGQVGQAFTYQIAASNNPTSFGASGLPSGLNLNMSTGLVSGTPTQNGTFPVSLSAVNASGTGTAALTLTIAPAPVIPPVITSVLAADVQEGQSFSYQITANNSPTSFDASGLPTGLNIDSGTGLISGIPTQAGSFPVTLGALNAGGRGTASLTITVAPALPVVTLIATTPTVIAGSGEQGVFTLSLSAPQDQNVTVSFTIKGSAVNGSDYVLLKGTKKIKAGKTSKPIKVTPLGDGAGPGVKRTVVIVLAPGDGYTVGTTGKIKVKIIGH